jgi:hypothetical protein
MFIIITTSTRNNKYLKIRGDIMEKYGKPIGDILDYKTHFWENNQEELLKRKNVAGKYREQPKRTGCKICGSELHSDLDSFERFNVEYIICGDCGHLNGGHIETESFVNYLYKDDEDQEVEYSSEYIEENSKLYESRLQDIYVPKAEFLFEALKDNEENPKDLTYSDFGAGAGYMMEALNQQTASKVSGYEVSKEQVILGQKMNESINLHHIEADEIYQIAESANEEVITMIGVIEHIKHPSKMVKLLKENNSVQYLFCTFPMFSPTVYFELAFPEVMPRHLALGHTHLFQESSIDWLAEKGNFNRVAEWWFGQDIIDLMRSVETTVEESDDEGMSTRWQEMIYNIADELQLILDKNKKSSSVHILFEVN